MFTANSVEQNLYWESNSCLGNGEFSIILRNLNCWLPRSLDLAIDLEPKPD
jgi:hypothetical protein